MNLFLNHYKIYYFILISILLLFILLASSATLILSNNSSNTTSATTAASSSPSVESATTFIRNLSNTHLSYYPLVSSDDKCRLYEWDLLVYDDRYPIDQFYVSINKYSNNNSIVVHYSTLEVQKRTPDRKNYQYKLYIGTNFGIPYGSYEIILNSVNEVGQIKNITLSYNCDEINVEYLKFKVIGSIKNPIDYSTPISETKYYELPFVYILRIVGYNSSFNKDLYSLITGGGYDDNRVYYISNYYNYEYYLVHYNKLPSTTSITSDWSIDLYYYKQVINIKLPSLLQNSNNSLINLKFYPDLNLINYQIGINSIAFSRFEMKSTQLSPIFYLNYLNANSRFYFNYLLPISYIPSSGITTFIVPFYDYNFNYYNKSDLTLYNVSFTISTQINDQFVQVYSNSLKFYLYYYNTSIQDIEQILINETNIYEFVANIQDLSFIPTVIEYEISDPISLELPFGIVSGNSKKCSFSISLLYTTVDSTLYLLGDEFNINLNYTRITGDFEKPVISDIEILPLYSRSFLIVFDAYDLLSGIKNIKIRFMSSKSARSYKLDLINGTIMNGTFQFTVHIDPLEVSPLNYILEIYDNSGNSNLYYFNSVFSLSPFKMISFNFNDFFTYFTVNDILNIKFKYNNIDTTNISYYNKMYLQLKNNIKCKGDSIPVIFQFFYPYQKPQVEYLFWNQELQLWVSTFLMPSNIVSNSVRYSISPMYTPPIYNFILSDEFQLKLTANEYDMVGPLIIEISKLPINETIIQQKEYTTFGWRLKIQDLSGVKTGYVIVRGSLDMSIYNSTICSVTTILEGNQFVGTYIIKVSVSKNICVSQDYKITEIYLLDSNNMYTKFRDIDNFMKMDTVNQFQTPLLYFNNDREILKYYLDCDQIVFPTPTPTSSPISNQLSYGCHHWWWWCTPKPTITPTVTLFPTPTITSLPTVTPSNNTSSSTEFNINGPKLLSFQISNSSIDVGLKDRYLTINFQIYDNSGLKIYQLPTIYLNDFDATFLSSKADLTTFNDTYFNFTCKIEIPLGFSYPNPFLLNLYNLINNIGYVSGYSSQMLADLGFPYIVYTTQTNYQDDDQLVVLKESEYSNGILYIFGRSLNKVKSITITYSGSDSNKEHYYLTINNLLNQTNSVEESTGPIISCEYYPDETIRYETVIQVNNFTPISGLNFQIIANTDQGSVSNDLVLNKVIFVDNLQNIVDPLPSNPSQECKDKCNSDKGFGYCNQDAGGCICNVGYVGLDCNSQVINLTKPLFNSSVPLYSPIIQDYNILVSIVALREFDINNNLVRIYKFLDNDQSQNQQKWNYSVINETTSLYETVIVNDSDENGYQVNTTFKVTLRWFDNYDTIVFANQNLTMNPSTLKYTIEISSYPFKSLMNTLDLVMFTSIESISSSLSSTKCPYIEFGNTTIEDSHYIKLQVDDKSIYAKFIKRLVLDDNDISKTNINLLNQIDSLPLLGLLNSKAETYISISIPHFLSKIRIDPDFSVLLNFENSNSILKCSKSSSSHNRSLIAAIIIGGFSLFCFIAIFIGRLIYYHSSCINIKIFFYKIKFLYRYYRYHKEYELKTI